MLNLMWWDLTIEPYIHVLLLFSVPSVWIGVVEVSLRWWFPDEPDGFFSVFTDLCNDVKYIFIFVIGFGITAADDQGMKEVIRRGRWYYLFLGNNETNDINISTPSC